ncbi:MAG: hypothetical protein ACRDZY_05550 [Acidimicrobiales bacterium]
MATNRWLDRTQPQTLQNATILSYIQAVIGLIGGELGLFFPLGLVLIVGGGVGGWGIANEKKWAYWLALAVAAIGVLLNLVSLFAGSIGALINLLFWGALVGLLVHPQSREYRKTWFH